MGILRLRVRRLVLTLLATSVVAGCGSSQPPLTIQSASPGRPLPAQVQQILSKDLYKGAEIAYRVEDLDTGEVIYDYNSNSQMRIASCRKLFATGLAMEAYGPNYRYTTPVYRQGEVNDGVLDGDLILVASGDFVMGGRRGANGTIALTDLDHSEANNVGNAIAPAQDPLAGYKDLAREVAASGIEEIAGDVVIDDRLFEPFNFRNSLMANSVFVNDNLIDVEIRPSQIGQPAEVTVSPLSEAFSVVSSLVTVAGGRRPDVELSGGECFGEPACQGEVSGTVPIDGAPLFTDVYPQLHTFFVSDPSSFARTVFIEALRSEGVTVRATAVAPNPKALLPTPANYTDQLKVAQLTSPVLQQYINFVLKKSYNLGSELTLMLYGLHHGGRTLEQAMATESDALASRYGIAATELSFVDGSGGGNTRATGRALTSFLKQVASKPFADAFRESMTVLGSPGLLTEIPVISNDPTLAGSIGHMFAKSGTSARGTDQGEILLETRASTGYIDSKSGRRLVYFITVNEVGPLPEFIDFTPVFEDLDVIAALWWREL